MKKIIYILLCAFLVTSCQKADNNGDLGGFWKLLKIEELNNNTTIAKHNEDRFWAIQLSLITTNVGGKGRFQHTGDSLFIQMKEKPQDPKSFGFYNPDDEHFAVNKLTKKAMILQSDEVILTFRKF